MQPKPNERRPKTVTLPHLSSTIIRRLLIGIVALALITVSLAALRPAEAARAGGFFAALAPAVIPAVINDDNQPSIGPGVPQVGSNAPKSAASSTKPGSVLFFHKYASDAGQPAAVNTLLTLTNTNPRDAVTVRVFYVHDCEVDSKFVNLAGNQTRTLLASKELGTSVGYAVATAVDSRGLPTQFNWLIGSATIRDAAGHEASYNAVAVAKRTGGPAPLNDAGTGAEMRFNNSDYDRLPKVIAVDQLQNQAPGTAGAVSTDVTLYSPRADLSVTTPPALQINAVAYDYNGKPYPKTVSAGCVLSTKISSLWTDPAFNTIVTPGKPGWASFAATDSGKPVPLLGLNLTDAAGSPQHNARNLQALSWVDSYKITVPVKAPDSPSADLNSLNQPDATGGATGAGEMKAGSLLLYSRFVSGQYGSTQINLTNTHPAQKVRVRLFFSGTVEPAQVFDEIITLLPNQTTTINASEIAPEQHGWVLAMAIDPRAMPFNFNYLIGSAQISEVTGYVAGFGAIAIGKNSAGAVARNDDVMTSDLRFDDVNYDRLPATLGLGGVPSQADNNTILGYSRSAPSLLTPPNTRGNIAVVLFDDTAASVGAQMGITEARLSALKPTSASPPITSTILKGRRGYLMLLTGTPLFGWFSSFPTIPFAANTNGWSGGLSGGGNLHILTTSDSHQIQVPSINPNNHPPTAIAETIGVYVEARGPGGTIVRLDGRASFDPDEGDPLTYQWYDNDKLVSTQPVGDYKLSIGGHAIKLVVMDGSNAVSPDQIQLVEVRDLTPPQISGIPSTITKVTNSQAGSPIFFKYPKAYDMVDGPVNVTPSKPSGSVFPVGTTTVTFKARDIAGNTATATMNVVLVKDNANFPATGGVVGDIAPIMNNLNDQYVPLDTTRNITLEAADADNEPVTFSLIGAPPFAQITDTDPSGRKATLQIAPKVGDRVVSSVRVVATDSRGLSFTTLPFRIMIDPVPNDETGSGGGIGTGGGGDGGDGGGGDSGGGGPTNHPPVAVAASIPATVKATSKQGAEVHLDGSASNDPDNDPLTYTWRDGDQVIAQGAIVDVTFPVGQHSITLTVADPAKATSTTAPLKVEILPRDLTLASSTPSKVSQFGYATITIMGTGFNASSKVSLGCSTSCTNGSGITITSYLSIEEDKIVVAIKTTSSTTLGNRDVIVTNPGGVSARLARALAVVP